MISKVYTYKESPVSANELVLYRFLVIMLTIRKFKAVTLPKLQVYLWGLKNDNNKRVLIAWKKGNKISNAPWLVGDDTPQIITQCICNHYVKMEQNKSGKISYVLDYASTQLFQDVSGLEIEEYITNDLDEIGGITDKLLDNIVFDF